MFSVRENTEAYNLGREDSAEIGFVVSVGAEVLPSVLPKVVQWYPQNNNPVMVMFAGNDVFRLVLQPM